jgi:hypothetical protein
MFSSMLEKVVLSSSAVYSLISMLSTQLCAAPITSKNAIWLEDTRTREGHKKETTALKLHSMLTAMQFLFFNKVTLMPPTRAYTQTTASSVSWLALEGLS